MRETAAWIMTGIWLGTWLFLYSPVGIAACVLTGIAAFKLADD